MRVTVTPRSDQWNADDFIGGPRTFTVSHVIEGVAERPYDIHFSDGGERAWRPPNGVLTLLIEAWSNETSTWTGRRVTLYRDPDIRFGPDKPGGIRVSHMSDLPSGKPFTARVTVSRGKKGPMTVQPLKEPPAAKTAPAPTASDLAGTNTAIANAQSADELMAIWEASDKGAQTRALMKERKAELDALEPSGLDLYHAKVEGEK